MNFIKNKEEDKLTTVLMPSQLKERFREYRNALYGLYLGRDVKLYFSKDAPEIPEWEPDELFYYVADVKEMKQLKLRKNRIIERIIVTDLLFRLYYDIYPKIKHLLKEYREMKKLLKNFTMKQSAMYSSKMKEYIPFDRHYGATTMNVYCPEQLLGFKASCFPLMTLSGVIQLGMLHFFVSGRWEEINEVVSELKSYEVGGKLVKPNVIEEPSEVFLSDCKNHYDDCVRYYTTLLRRFIDDVKKIAEERDPLEQFILSSLPISYIDLYVQGIQQGYEGDEIIFKLRDLVRRGIIVHDSDGLIKPKS